MNNQPVNKPLPHLLIFRQLSSYIDEIFSHFIIKISPLYNFL